MVQPHVQPRVPSRREPMFTVPVVISAVLGVLLVIHVIRLTLPDVTDQWLVLALAFIPDRYGSHPQPWPGGTASAVMSPMTHMLIHGDWAHLALNGSSLLIFGGLLARRMPAARFLAFTVYTGVAGAFVFWVFNRELEAPMIGASGAIAGMMAAALRVMFSAIASAPSRKAARMIRTAPWLIPVKGLAATLSDRRILVATAIWFMVNALAVVGLGTPAASGPVAWEAHVGGYLAGLLGFGLFDGPAPKVGVPVPHDGEQALLPDVETTPHRE